MSKKDRKKRARHLLVYITRSSVTFFMEKVAGSTTDHRLLYIQIYHEDDAQPPAKTHNDEAEDNTHPSYSGAELSF